MRMKCYMTTTDKARIKGESILSLHIISNTLPRRLTQVSTFKKVQLGENLKNLFIFCVDTAESWRWCSSPSYFHPRVQWPGKEQGQDSLLQLQFCTSLATFLIYIHLANQQRQKNSWVYSRSYIKMEIFQRAASWYFISNFNSISINKCFYQLQLRKVILITDLN